MTRVQSLYLAFLGWSIASALTLNLTSPIDSQQALSTIDASKSSKLLRLGSNVSNLTFDADCNEAASSVDLTVENCHDLVSNGIPDVLSQSIISYGDRSFGNFGVNLPQRYISGK